MQKRYAITVPESDMGRKFIFCISDEMNDTFNVLEEAESIRRIPRDRSKLAESVRICPRSTATTSLDMVVVCLLVLVVLLAADYIVVFRTGVR